LGEDGPTHQPVEHAATLRYIPNLDVWRPCDAAETATAWKSVIERSDGPGCLLLSRQPLPHQPRTKGAVQLIERGGYVLSDPDNARPTAIIIATGSEVEIAMAAQRLLHAGGVHVRVVSMPSTTVFDRQPEPYRNLVLPANLPCIAVEAGICDFWRKYVGRNGCVVGIDRFGESAPAERLYEYFGITAENVAMQTKRLISQVLFTADDDADSHILRSSN
jgi:transketolase